MMKAINTDKLESSVIRLIDQIRNLRKENAKLQDTCEMAADEIDTLKACIEELDAECKQWEEIDQRRYESMEKTTLELTALREAISKMLAIRYNQNNDEIDRDIRIGEILDVIDYKYAKAQRGSAMKCKNEDCWRETEYTLECSACLLVKLSRLQKLSQAVVDNSEEHFDQEYLMEQDASYIKDLAAELKRLGDV